MSDQKQPPRQFLKAQLKERQRRDEPPTTIQSDPAAKPSKWHHGEIAAPLEPKTPKEKKAAARLERILAASEREVESPMTLSGLSPEQRRAKKRWLRQEGRRLRAKAAEGGARPTKVEEDLTKQK